MITFPNAKINLGLHVTERRADGYHNLETLFLPVSLTDALEIIPSGNFSFSTSGIPLENDEDSNLVVKAFRLLQKDFNLPQVSIHLHKVIPPGAGLGGGSSDAAFALKMISELFSLKLSITELEKYAANLGADCPFFVGNIPSLAFGKGDLLTPINIDMSGLWVAIVKPPSVVNTSWAYKIITPQAPLIPLREIVILPPEYWQNLLVNDFEKYVFPYFPEISEIKTKLTGLGAVYASMSGSGSAVFGLFREIPEDLGIHFPEDYFISI